MPSTPDPGQSASEPLGVNVGIALAGPSGPRGKMDGRLGAQQFTRSAEEFQLWPSLRVHSVVKLVTLLGSVGVFEVAREHAQPDEASTGEGAVTLSASC